MRFATAALISCARSLANGMLWHGVRAWQAEERAYVQRKHDRKVCEEAFRLEMEQRRARTRAAALRVEKALATQKAEHAAHNQAARHESARAEAEASMNSRELS